MLLGEMFALEEGPISERKNREKVVMRRLFSYGSSQAPVNSEYGTLVGRIFGLPCQLTTRRDPKKISCFLLTRNLDRHALVLGGTGGTQWKGVRN